MATARDFLDVLLPLHTKSKHDTNQRSQEVVDMMLACEEDLLLG
jgi:hypothetical protein